MSLRSEHPEHRFLRILRWITLARVLQAHAMQRPSIISASCLMEYRLFRFMDAANPTT